MSKLLARYDALQDTRRGAESSADSDLGASSPLSKSAYGGEVGYQYRRQEESYGRALRQLRRASRRGDTGAALDEIAVRDRAVAAGFTPGGIPSHKAFGAEREATAAAWAAGAKDRVREAAIRRRQAAEEEEDDRLEEDRRPARESRPPLAEEFRDEGIGRVNPPSDYESPLRQPARRLGATGLARLDPGVGRKTPLHSRSLLHQRRLA